jgi:hypothetical protein
MGHGHGAWSIEIEFLASFFEFNLALSEWEEAKLSALRHDSSNLPFSPDSGLRTAMPN